jgi:hypothetical protein
MPDPCIFICYRRGDSPHHAHRLSDSLAATVGGDKVFIDLRTPGGAQVREYITRSVRSAGVLLVVIGPNWLSVRDEGGRRLDSEDDYVRLEILTAREHHVAILPVRVDGAGHPAAGALPAELRFLADINSVSIGNGVHWHTDMEHLATAVEEILRPGGGRRRRWPLLVAAGLVLATATATVAMSGLLGGEPAAKKCESRPGDPDRGIYCVVNPCESYPDTCTLPVYSSPGGAPVADRLEDDEQIHIVCQVRGKRFSGQHGATDIWDRLDGGNYVTDYFVNTRGLGGFDSRLARCPRA